MVRKARVTVFILFQCKKWPGLVSTKVVQLISLRKGLVLRCSTDEGSVQPAVVPQKIYFWTFDKNMTESELINTV